MDMRVAIRIFDARERQHLEQILGLATRRSGRSLATVPAAEADVVFLMLDDPGADLFLQASLHKRRPLVVIYGTPAPGHTLHLAKPACTANLLPLLADLHERLQDKSPRAATAFVQPGAAGATQSPATALPAPRSRLMPVEHCAELLGALEQIRLRPKPLLVLAAAGFPLYVDQRAAAVHLPSREYPGSLRALADVLRDGGVASLQEIDRVSVSQVLRESEFVKVGLDEFGWALAMGTPTNADAVRRCADATGFRLRHWPNFTRLQHTPVHMAWTARLVRGPLSLAELAVKSSLDEAARFYNACVLCGIAEHHTVRQQPAPAVSLPVDGAKASILQRIVRKLAG